MRTGGVHVFHPLVQANGQHKYESTLFNHTSSVRGPECSTCVLQQGYASFRAASLYVGGELCSLMVRDWRKLKAPASSSSGGSSLLLPSTQLLCG
jgi:hypothetical protein